ncbi:MAG: 1,4-beta-D-glucan glucohydrolase [bacterium]|nr:1,4-beta-D-glucan glucohydrolase [bacterium]
MERNSMSFPNNFVWGAAAASYQIEGAAYEEGKGLSVWDMMCKTPGKIWEGNTGDVACDHYHRYDEDARLMQEIGLQAYRLSISWPRVLPGGTGAINEKGLAFYDRLIDTLLKNNIQPWVTLFHWDYPYALYCRGGWLNRDSADWFAEYTQVIIDKLSDRVLHWITQNEPQCYIGLGHQAGEHAPGLKLGFAEVLRAAHHSLLAHGKSVQVIRARAKIKPAIGAAPVGIAKIPASNQPEDINAARAATFAISGKNCWSNAWFADPMIFGKYPEDGLKLFAAELPEIRDGDMKTICQPLDFYGVNIYFDETVRARSNGGYEVVKSQIGPPLTTMPWEVTPEALYWGPKFLFERYQLPIVVTENGMANCDWIHLDGKVHDPQRIDFLTRYLRAYHRAMADGVVAQGYFIWSVMDNFEWGHGYKQRFGLIYVDYPAQKRILKDSAYWYKEVIASNGAKIF